MLIKIINTIQNNIFNKQLFLIIAKLGSTNKFFVFNNKFEDIIFIYKEYDKREIITILIILFEIPDNL